VRNHQNAVWLDEEHRQETERFLVAQALANSVTSQHVRQFRGRLEGVYA
jgi:hypothetical protein